MSKARAILALQLFVGALGAAATALALSVALSTVTLHTPSSAALLAACRSFVLPQVTPGSVLALALGSVAFAVLALAARSGSRQVIAGRRFIAALDIVGPTGRGALLFADIRPLAFCAGLRRPWVYVSTGTLDALEDDELEAVLAHEAHHARYRDPLRIFVVRVLSDSLFFLPVLRRLAERYSSLAELAADDAAVRRHAGDSRPLAAALLAFDTQASSTVVGIAPERVDQLMGERTPWQLPLALLAWAMVAVLALVVVALRTAAATDAGMVSLPLVAAQLCMVAMAVLPVMAGAGALLGSRRLVQALRR